MASTKYKTVFDEMISNHEEEFSEFKKLATLFSKNRAKNEEAFKEAQRKVLWLVRKAENRLCTKTENTRFSDFSTNLAEKFWEEVRLKYPEVDWE